MEIRGGLAEGGVYLCGRALGQWWKQNLALGQSLSSWNGSLNTNLIFHQSTPAIHGGVPCSPTIPWREST